MAEPLLKRTFSRLRGKEKYRRKTDPKLGEIHGKVDFLQSSSSSLSSSSSAVQAEPPQAVPVEDTSRRGTQITVAKKQNWAKLSSSSSSSSSRDPPSTEGPHGLGSRAHTWDSCSGKAQVSKQAWSQKTAGEEGPESRRKDFERDPGVTAIPYEVPGAALPELTHPAAGYGEICASSSGEKLSGQGAYLQTLDRSSRAWVLSTGKGGPAAGRRGQGDYGNPWRKREADGSPENRRDPQSRTQRWAGLLGSSGSRLERHGSNASQCMLGAPGTGSDAKEFAVESSATACKESPDLPQQAVQVESQQAGAVAGGNGAGAGPSDSPGSQKKGGGAGSSVIDRIKSPGTVRRLSLKMRKLPELRRKLSLRSSRTQRPGAGQTPPATAPTGRPPPTRARSPPTTGGALGRDGGHARPPPLRRGRRCRTPPRSRPYCLSEQPRCAQRVSGLLMVHLMGAEEILKAPGPTAARRCSAPSSVSPSAARPKPRLRPGEVAIPPLFRSSRSQQLCVKLEPRGLLYVKLTLLEQWDPPSPSQSALQPASVFGVGLRRLVDKEGSALKVPLIIQKCVAEIEKRGLKVVGLYRLCGSAAVKKELRDAFERDSGAVALTEELYPDINVITGILKDYLRELPSPLITRTLYEVVLEAMTLRPPRAAPCGSNGEVQRSHSTVSLLECLPEPEKATLALLLDHLSLVASPGGRGPPGPRRGRGPARGRSFTDSEEIASAVDFKRHIEALHYLLQLWPIPTGHATEEGLNPDSVSEQPPSPALHVSHNALQHRGQRLPLRLDLPQDVVVSRRGRGRLESPPCNRYAGDWSVCGRDFLSSAEADYDEVAGSDSEEEEAREPLKKSEWAPPGPLYVDEFALGPEALDLDLDAPFTCRLSLKDFDTLISDLERELSKQINICL
ncbi:hypothetical protein ANANG_G00033870 [Anguilla anguilla]|uniref:Rho-GAP domain-containing protein n=1 Tax=Anguilla anguilla TaxID=7936 RepID=A0A9D3MWA6_ANGAN|nr:hypothetical protein ANANG_G00033870 [Anguilla anguilla]